MTEQRGSFVVLDRHDEAAHPELAHWHGNIGEPIALDLATAAISIPTTIDVVSWNVAIGLGRIEDVINRITSGAFDSERAASRPIILLLQEAYRSDDTIPEILKSAHHGGKSPRSARHDIVDVARSLGFSLRYAPSMRNGRHRSDRGNAILSSAAINDASAFALPHVRQLRVAVTARLAGLPRVAFASAHLDTRGRPRDAAAGSYVSGRAAQAAALGHRLARDAGDGAVLIGADLNSYLATRDPLMAGLIAAGFRRVRHEPRATHTFHARPLRLLLDHVLVRGEIGEIRVRRLDEHSRDRGRFIFGSDHHPLLATIETR